MAKSKFYEEIKSSLIEREVEDVYNKGINLYFPEVAITHPFACDGFIDTITGNHKILKLIIEYKLDEVLKSNTGKAKVLVQVLYYMKRFEQNGLVLPNVCMVGDINECFVLHTNPLLPYLDENVNWEIAPSEAHKYNPELVAKIANNDDINPFVFEINETFSFKEVSEKIINLADNIQRYVRVTEHNISNIYDYFVKNVIKDTKKIAPNDLVSIFMGVITDKDNYYKHPSKSNTLVTPSKEVNINGKGFDSFFSYFDRTYTPQEKNKFTEISDRLIEDTKRRNTGEFYTPTLFVDYAHDMLTKKFGEDWKEKFVVWDNCFDGETEYLSEHGWKKLSQYNGEKVMQYNQDGSAKFVIPLRYINQQYNGEMLHYVSSQLDILCTPDHNFVVKNDRKDRCQNPFKISANDIFVKYNKIKNIHLAVPKTFTINGDFEIDENLLRVYVAVNADGTYCKKGNWFCVRVKKERKVKRMAELLFNAKIKYKTAVYGDYTEYRFHLSINPKHFPSEWYNLSTKCKNVIMEEILLWDGSLIETKYGTRKSYSTSKKDDADFISFVASSCGYGVNFSEDKRNSKTNYRLSFTRITNAKISTKSTFVKETNTNGKVYCFEVPSGMLVVRRNGKIYVSSNCCGTKNLTRDYYFKELYCSTLENAELEISSRYNKEATSFQFDFLNESLDKLPEGLIKAFKENKPIIFLINPPYATATNRDETSKKGVAKTLINEEMLTNGIGSCSQNLYAQFLYRIAEIKKKYNLTNVHIGLFSPTLFLTGSSWKNFRNYFLNEFAFDNAVQFKASHFADVADSWGISFSVWSCGETIDKNNFNYNLIDNIDGEIKVIGEKDVYNIDGKISISDWAKESIKNLKTFDEPNVSSGICIRDKENNRGKNFIGSFGFINNGGNNIDQNTQMVAMFSTAYGNGNGHGINETNFTKCTALFSARKLIEKNWVNSKDEYLAPNENHPAYKEFENDSIIYSLFHSASNQSSLRNVEYKGKNWDIKNEFFFMGKDEIAELANANYNDYCFEDCRKSNERYVYTLLNNITLSPEAQAVLDYAKELVRKSFQYRNLFDEEHPEYQINNWDCGWYQIKALVKEFLPNDYKEFTELYKKLSDKMRPMVYELGFLK